MKLTFFKLKFDDGINIHIWRALKNRMFLTFFMIVLIALTAILAAINIKIVQYITALLVSKSIIGAANNRESLYDLLSSFNIDPKQIDMILDQYGSPDFIQKIINKLFYDFVNYDGKTLFITLFGFKLNVYDFLVIMVTNILIIVFISYIIYLISGVISRSYETKLKNELINYYIDQDLQYFNENKTGELISTLVKDTSILGQYIKEAPVSLVRTGLVILISSIIMFIVDWKLTLCVFGLLTVCMFGVFLFSILSVSATKKISKLTKDYENDMSEKIYSIRLIKSSGTFDQEKNDFEKVAKQVDKKNKLKLLLSEIPAGLIIGGVGSFSMASVMFGVILYYENSQTLISIITTFTTGVIVMTMPLLDLRFVLSQVPAAKYGAKNLYNLFNYKIKIDKHKKTIFDQKVKTIKFDNVDFSYNNDDKMVFKNINITFEKGKSYAFVGPTGSGKSTIAKLFLRFYDTTNGNIIINDAFNLKDINLKSWLDKIGYVDQEPQILSGTIFDNIKYGIENVEPEQVYEAAKKALLHDLIMSWEDQYDTVLFERGAQLSGGQKQRLVIARLILKNPEILILDEATSALDTKVEKEIQSELEKLMVGRTTISIAHRLSTIKNFDKIFVMEANKGIVQIGNYEKLIKEDGIFKVLYELST
ncbi:ABC transporter ATP-binding protein [Spiroplasma tabanidicola]|uniref:ATP-binding cassette n=1 Tax=Spiroplasma tabanidicola TaxID=324079 RepID=A0A6I6C7T3_9MOLU|nr:ABC transporter ATP-binding protein [Spiroplasma tabanidicola]QGS51836.1 ATP-binding cassette [Spiroplasma tabanidicola]